MSSISAACGPPGQGTGAGERIEHSRGSEDLVLRVEDVGIFGPLAWTLQALPSFSLYGDGRVIVPAPQIEIYPPPLLGGVIVRRLSEEGVQAILRAAREAGLHGPDRRYEVEGVDDAGATQFTVVADGESHVSIVAALGHEDPEYVPPEDRDARSALLEFTSSLSRLHEWLPAGSFGDEELDSPGRLRIFTNPYDLELGEFLAPVNVDFPEPPPEELPTIDWPIEEPLARFGEPMVGYQDPPRLAIRCGSVEGRELKRFVAAAEGASELTPWESNGARYALVVRPLLPDDPDCPSA